ncbi:MAG: ribosome maturation factor RimP [Clostridia bacterium]|nr:ribosome maturation factor RimP [Clostridia bacterium]
MKKNITQICEELAEPVAEELGYVIWDTEYVKEGGRYILRYTIDRDGGVGIDDCEKFHRAIDPLLDEADPIEESYTLEVSSPGIERELKYEWHYECCEGDTVEVHLYKPYEGSKLFVGTLLPLDGNVNVEVAGRKYAFPRSSVSKVNIYFDIKSINQEENGKI